MDEILYLTQVLPYPLDSGAKIRAYYVLRHLTEHHRVTLVSFVRPDDRPEFIEHLASFCSAVHTVPMRRTAARTAWALARAALTGQSAIILRDEIPEMQALLRALVKQSTLDVVHADQASMAQYALYARHVAAQSRGDRRPAAILDAHNALYLIPRRMAESEPNPLKQWGFRREARALARYEAQVYPQFDRVVFVSAEDRDAILAAMRRYPPRHLADGEGKGQNDAVARIEAAPSIPICVDPAERSLVERSQHPRTILHLGTMFWPPNIEGVLWFAREVFPRIQAQVPDARFAIVGKNPPPSVVALSDNNPSIEVTGYVADPTPYQQETAAFIVPLHAGGGMRVKIIDAWGWGLPIVSTSIGAEGIDVRHGENILLGDSPEDFSDAVVRLLREPELGGSLRLNGRAWLEGHYAWQRVYQAWDEIYREATASAELT